MSSKVKMLWAKHPEEGIISVEDVELNLSLRKNLVCVNCSVPLTFVERHIRNESLISSFFKLRRGYKNHWKVGDEQCNFNSTNNNKTTLRSSKSIQGYVDEKDLLCRVNIPIDLEQNIMELLSKDQIKEFNLSQDKEMKKESPGTYETSKEKLPNYFNSAKALSNLAELTETEPRFRYLELKFHGVKAKWKDVYHENWDFLYNKIKSKQPKEIYCLRGLLSSVSENEYMDKMGNVWITLNLKKTPINESEMKESNETFTKIQLFKPMFENFLTNLKKASLEYRNIEITFFGRVEKFTIGIEKKQNLKGIAVLRKQVHFEKSNRRY